MDVYGWSNVLAHFLLVVVWLAGGAFVLAWVLDRADLARERKLNERRRARMARESARLERIGR